MLTGQAITVLGAGIGGLAVGRALALRGARVRVLEQAPELREVGAGVQISPNGACVLEALGLGAAAGEAGLRAEAVDLIDGETGGSVLRMDLARLRPGQVYRFFHRADLLKVLEDGAREAGVEICLGRAVASVDLGKARPRLIGPDGTAEEVEILIGADGLHSPTRTALNGTVAPFFTHQVAWRAVLPAEPGAAPVARVYMGPGKHLVTYPLRGGRYRNIVAVEERRKWVEESWSLSDDPLALRIAFENFVPEVRAWLDRIERPNLWGLFRHPVAARWHGPAVAILGDAAHPTLPFLAQGASMALEDAWVLAASLAGHDSVEAGLAAYQAARMGRVKRIVEAANSNARNYHLSGLRRELGHAGLRLAGRLAPGRILGRFDWLYGHDVTAG
jgi:salicylate hydroxylase